LTPRDHDRTMTRSRRRLLRTGVLAGVLALAGCTGESTGTDEADAGGDGSTPTRTGTSTPDPATTTAGTDGSTSTDDASTATATPTPTPTSTGTDGGLDLREANVVGVSISGGAGGDVRFDVTLHHDDEGEDGYANWWQVESLAGEQLGRRELLHAHGTREFTRSAAVSVPAGTSCVVVRGHDQTHGYGGRAALVALDSGAVRLLDQGAESRTFDEGDCP
jgi:hypothetical protein